MDRTEGYVYRMEKDDIGGESTVVKHDIFVLRDVAVYDSRIQPDARKL